MMTDILDEGPFFHGTIADLRVGDSLTAGYRSNYRPEVVMSRAISNRCRRRYPKIVVLKQARKPD